MCNSLKSEQKNEHVVLRVLPMTGLFGTEPRARIVSMAIFRSWQLRPLSFRLNRRYNSSKLWRWVALEQSGKHRFCLEHHMALCLAAQVSCPGSNRGSMSFRFAFQDCSWCVKILTADSISTCRHWSSSTHRISKSVIHLTVLNYFLIGQYLLITS
jgi:hypothetical protein